MARLLRNPFERSQRAPSGGLNFERLVTSYLSERLGNQYVIVPNVIVDNSSDLSAGSGAVTRREIDLIIIGPNGVFLLEAKSYHGAVDGLLWGHWDITKVDRDGLPLPFRQKSERKEAVVMEERMYRVSALIEKYVNRSGLRSLGPFKKVRGIFVFPDGTSINFLARDGSPANPRADVRALTLARVVESIEKDPLPPRAQPISKREVVKLAEVVDKGVVSAAGTPPTEKVGGHYKLEEELYKDQAPNGLHFTVYGVRDLNTGIRHRGKYYDWTPMDVTAQAVWNEQVQRHKTALSALSSNRRIHQIITAMGDEEGYGYLVVERWMNNPTLQELLNSPRDLERLDLARFMKNIALGMRSVHGSNFVHRELSPKSVFVDLEESEAVITSFELAKVLSDKAASSSMQVPTVFTRRVPPNSYRAPEMALTPHDVDCRADIYSWGAIYYRLTTGHQFRNEPKAFEIGRAHV